MWLAACTGMVDVEWNGTKHECEPDLGWQGGGNSEVSSINQIRIMATKRNGGKKRVSGEQHF